MSEVINNRQERIDIMKSLIHRLHEGSEKRKSAGSWKPYWTKRIIPTFS